MYSKGGKERSLCFSAVRREVARALEKHAQKADITRHPPIQTWVGLHDEEFPTERRRLLQKVQFCDGPKTKK